jgi:hypothetical protein
VTSVYYYYDFRTTIIKFIIDSSLSISFFLPSLKVTHTVQEVKKHSLWQTGASKIEPEAQSLINKGLITVEDHGEATGETSSNQDNFVYAPGTDLAFPQRIVFFEVRGGK